MSNGNIKNRWFVVIGAILIQLCLGAIYAWSVFTPSLVAADWTKAQTQAVFAAGLALFAIVIGLVRWFSSRAWLPISRTIRWYQLLVNILFHWNTWWFRNWFSLCSTDRSRYALVPG